MTNKELFQIFGYLLAANTQALVLCVAAFFFAKKLDAAYPLAVSWKAIIWPLMGIAILHTYVVCIRLAIKIDKKKKKDQ